METTYLASLDPSGEQGLNLARSVGSARYVWNYFTGYVRRHGHWKELEDMKLWLEELKRPNPYLGTPCTFMLHEQLSDLANSLELERQGGPAVQKKRRTTDPTMRFPRASKVTTSHPFLYVPAVGSIRAIGLPEGEHVPVRTVVGKRGGRWVAWVTIER